MNLSLISIECLEKVHRHGEKKRLIEFSALLVVKNDT